MKGWVGSDCIGSLGTGDAIAGFMCAGVIGSTHPRDGGHPRGAARGLGKKAAGDGWRLKATV